MIRPFTVVTFLMACGSGLYLYQSKHEVQVLDRTIERTVHDSAALREQSRELVAEWTMLTNPERLRQFADTYLKLKTVDAKQYSSLGDLDRRLAPPQTEAPPAGAEEEPVPVEMETPLRSEHGASKAAIASKDFASLPVVAPVHPAPAAAGHPADAKVALARSSAGADAQARTVGGDVQARPVGALVQARPVGAGDARAADPRAVGRPGDEHVAGRDTSAQRPITLVAPRPVPAGVPARPTPAPVPVVCASGYGRGRTGGCRGGATQRVAARHGAWNDAASTPPDAGHCHL